MNRIKKVLFFVVLITMFSMGYSRIYSILPPEDETLQVGDYVEFGHYNQSPILWRIIDRDPQKGMLLWSEKILTIKAYDSKGNPNSGENTERQRIGGNLWADSTLRNWLNSDQSRVSYIHFPPNEERVWMGHNDYADKPGFLYEFTAQEKSLIQEITQKSILSTKDLDRKDGGGAPFVFQGSRNPVKSIQNYEDAYFHSVTDKVFLLDIKQLAEFVSKRGLEFKKRPTAQAVEESEFKPAEMAPDKNYMYWIRTPIGNSDAGMLKVSADGVVGDVVVDNRNLGVVPALYIKPDLYVLSGGGTLKEPYTMGLGTKGDAAPAAKKARVADIPKEENIQYAEDSFAYPSSAWNQLAPWAKESVDFVKGKQILKDAFFEQFKKNLTRQETAYLVVRLYEFLAEKSLAEVSVHVNHLFTDTDDEFVRKAFYIGVMNGYENQSFGPKDELTREQMMTILVKLLSRLGIDLKVEQVEMTVFKDEKRISEWAKESVQKAYHYKILNGTEEKTISPKRRITKEQAFVLMAKIIQNLDALKREHSTVKFKPLLKWAYGGTYDSWCEESYYSTPAIGDLNRDGSLEIIGSAYSVVNVDANTGRLNWRVVSGHDIHEKEAKYEGRTYPNIVMEDIDGDGHTEFVTAHQKGYISVYDERGAFKRGWPQKPIEEEFRALKVADLDLDGKMEIIAGAAVNSGRNLWVFNYDGTLRKGWPQLDSAHDAAVRKTAREAQGADNGFAWGIFSDNISIGNINNDKYLEIIAPSDVPFVCAYDKDGNLLDTNPLFKGRKWGKVGFWESIEMEHKQENEGWGLPPEVKSPASVRNTVNFASGGSVVTDVDGDGVNEIVVTGNVYDRMIGHPPGLYTTPFILNPDRTRFKKPGMDWSESPKDTGKPLSEDYNLIENNLPNPVVSDLNHDGKKEILYSSYDGRVHCFSLDKSEKDSWPFKVYHAEDPVRNLYEFASIPETVDLDGDGLKEVIFSTWTEKEPDAKGKTYNGRLVVLNAKGELLSETELPFSLGTKMSNGAMAKPLVADIDKDNEYEIVLNSVYSGIVAYELEGTLVK